MSPSAFVAWFVLFVFFLANFGTDGFPLKHVERPKFRYLSATLSPPGKRAPMDNRPNEVWNVRALAVNALVGALLAFVAGSGSSALWRRLMDSLQTADARDFLAAEARVVDEHEDARDRHEQPGQ
jgi:hypothetical protein